MIIRIRVNIIMTFSRFGFFINNDTFIIMTSVLNIEPNYLLIRNIKGDMVYDFLDFLKEDYKVDITKYYDLLNTLDTFKLKNVYQFLYLRTYKINEKESNIRCLPKKNKKISDNEINEYLNEYINPNNTGHILMNSIIIMNGIQLYFYPDIN